MKDTEGIKTFREYFDKKRSAKGDTDFGENS